MFSNATQRSTDLEGRPSVLFCYFLSVILFTSAVGKLWLLLIDPFAEIRAGLPNEIIWVSVALDFWLAFENFTIRNHRILLLLNTVVFSGFLVFSFVRMFMGYSSCGCMGKLEVPTWLILFFDSAIVIAILRNVTNRKMISMGWREAISRYSSYSVASKGRIFGAIIFCIVLLVIQLPGFASVRGFILGKELITATVEYQDHLILDQETVIEVEIRNRSGIDASVAGIASSCGCVRFTRRPRQIGSSLVVPVEITPNRTGTFAQRILVFLDHPNQFRMNIDVLGFVKKE